MYPTPKKPGNPERSLPEQAGMGRNPAAAWMKRKRESASMGQVEEALGLAQNRKKRAREEVIIETPIEEVIKVQVSASLTNLESPLHEKNKDDLGRGEERVEESGEGEAEELVVPSTIPQIVHEGGESEEGKDPETDEGNQQDAQISVDLNIINRHLRSEVQVESLQLPEECGDSASIDAERSVTNKLTNLTAELGTIAKRFDCIQNHLSRVVDLREDVSKTKRRITVNLRSLIEEINTGELSHDKQVELLGKLKLDMHSSSLMMDRHVEESGMLAERVKRTIKSDKSWMAKCAESVERKLSEITRMQQSSEGKTTEALGNGLEEVTHTDRIGSDDDYHDDENDHEGGSDDSFDASIPPTYKAQRSRQKTKAKSPATGLKNEELKQKNREELGKWMNRSIVEAQEHWAELVVLSPQRVPSPTVTQGWPIEGRSPGYKQLGEPSSSVVHRRQQDVVVIDDQSDVDTMEECTHTQPKHLSRPLPLSPLSAVYPLLDIYPHDPHTSDGLYCPSPRYPPLESPYTSPTQQLSSDTPTYRVTIPAFSSPSSFSGHPSKSYVEPLQREWTKPELVVLFEGIEKFWESKHKWAECVKNWDEMGDGRGKGKAKGGAVEGGGGKGLLKERTVEQIKQMGREISREFAGARGGESWVEIGRW